MTRKLISILLILLIFSSAALADVPVLDLRAHDADARFPSDAAVLTVAFPQMTFADAAILVCDGHAGMIDAGGYAEESAVQTALETLGVTRLDWVVRTTTISPASRPSPAGCRLGDSSRRSPRTKTRRCSIPSR